MLSFHRSLIGSRFFKNLLHLLDRDLGRIVADCIDLFKTFKTLLHCFHTRQPIQGCFSNIISGHIKNSRFWIHLGLGNAQSRCKHE